MHDTVLGTSWFCPSASAYGPEVVPQRLETSICAFHRHSIRIASIHQVNRHQVYPWHPRISKCDWFLSRVYLVLPLLTSPDAAKHHSNKDQPRFQAWRHCKYEYCIHVIITCIYYPHDHSGIPNILNAYTPIEIGQHGGTRRWKGPTLPKRTWLTNAHGLTRHDNTVLDLRKNRHSNQGWATSTMVEPTNTYQNLE